MLKHISIKIIAVAIGLLLMVRLFTISEGIPISILTRPSADVETLKKVIKHNPNHAYAHEQLALLAYQDKHFSVAKHHALKTLQNNLSSGMATAILMGVFDQENNPKLAHQAAQLSAHLWPAHDVSMRFIADHWLKAGFTSKAMSAWNVSLSQDPRQENFSEGIAAQTIFPLLNKAAQYKESTQLFQPYHAEPPKWWDEFFQYMVVQPENLAAVDRFYQQTLLNGNASDTNRKLYLSNLMQENEWPQAHDAWEKGLPAKRKQYTGLIYDGGFESNQLNVTYTDDKFSWAVGNKTHVQVYLDRFSRASGSYSLRVAFNNWVDDYWGYIRQLLVLKPGEYTLEYKTRANINTENGLRWVLYCLKDKQSEKNIVELGIGQPLSGFFDWKKDFINFTVPEDASCKAQKLALILAGRASEARIRGDIWFDDFVVRPKDPKDQ